MRRGRKAERRATETSFVTPSHSGTRRNLPREVAPHHWKAQVKDGGSGRKWQQPKGGKPYLFVFPLTAAREKESEPDNLG